MLIHSLLSRLLSVISDHIITKTTNKTMTMYIGVRIESKKEELCSVFYDMQLHQCSINNTSLKDKNIVSFDKGCTQQ